MGRLFLRIKESIAPIIDRIRLERKFPLFSEYYQQSQRLREELLPFYNHYISCVSGPNSAISLELARLMLTMCNLLQPKRVLDLGSGFSSFVFRHFMARTGGGFQVWSIDDREAWLDKTRDFLTIYDLPHDNTETWDSFSKRPNDPFDLILHDLGHMDVRQETLPQVIKLLSPNGAIILDDMQKVPYRLYARQLLKDMNLKSYNLKFYTRDKFRRYSYLATY
jgi:predicted O-methyltransferase YrrM